MFTQTIQILHNTHHLRNFPKLPGVYLFKDSFGTILYIGKAKNLKNRLSYYCPTKKTLDVKTKALIASSKSIDYIITQNEVEALLLEAQLIRNHQPHFNILLKTGQPYLYLLFTSGMIPPAKGTQKNIPELKLVRNKKNTGTYFGPFLEKTHARRMHKFLTTTFQLKICNKKIENGCLDYHLGKCAGSCKSNFDKKKYLARLALAKKALQHGMIPPTEGHNKFLSYLDTQIKSQSKVLNFEKAQEFYLLKQSFEKIILSLQTQFSQKEKFLALKHIWIFIPDKQTLFLFDEQNGIIKKKDFFIIPSRTDHFAYLESYYHHHDCPQIIMTNFTIKNVKTYSQYLEKLTQSTYGWHNYPVTIITKTSNSHLQNLITLASIHAEKEIKKIDSLGPSLKKVLKLSKEPQTIDCFDISHKQGMHMVGSCIRFKNGNPDKNNFRKFKIKTLSQQNDCAALQEIVLRRYKNCPKWNNSTCRNLPDLILVDGGKGQLNAIVHLFENVECACLAKKEEFIFSKKIPEGKKLNPKTFVGQTLMALRDYAHHFAISYHKKLEKVIL